VIRPSTAARADDSGFTLVEVVAALAVMAVISTAALYFFVNGTRTVTHQSRSQAAVTVASESMEQAFAVSAKPVTKSGTTFSGLLVDRTQSEVDAAWNAATAAGLEGLDQSYPAWDPHPTSGGDPAVDLTRTTTLDGVAYTSDILIGTCYRVTTSTNPEDCTRVAGQVNDPGVAPAGRAQLLRVMVLVSWPDTAGVCDGTCTYQAQSLVDPNSDIVWNNTTRPIAMDDQSSVEVGAWVDIAVLLNDVLGPVTSDPVVNVTAPSMGSVSRPRVGELRYTAPANASGLVTFTYQLKDQAGHMSDPATVSVRVTGKALPDTATAVRRVSVSLPVTSNDLGSPTSVVIDTPPTGATATPNPDGRTVQFYANNVGTYTFRYHFNDGKSDSTQAEVTVVVTNYPAPLVADFTAIVPATLVTTDVDLNMLGSTLNPPGYLFEVMSMNINQGQLKIDGPSGVRNVNMSNYKRGTRFLYAPQTNVLGTWTFTYRVLDPEGGQPSAVKTVTIRIVPVAVDFTVNLQGNRSSEQRIDLKNVAGIAPTNFGGTVKLVDAAFPSCVTNPGNQEYQNGLIKVRTQGITNKTCTMAYQLVSPTDPLTVSDVKTITLVVGK